MRTMLLIIGLLAIAVGLLWIGQGLGLVLWPKESFMLNQTRWAWYGLGLAVAGVLTALRSRRHGG
jgi:hypothetical protein